MLLFRGRAWIAWTVIVASSSTDMEYLNRGSSEGCLGHFGLFDLLMMHSAFSSLGSATKADEPFTTRPHLSVNSFKASRTAAAGAPAALCRECRKKKQPSASAAEGGAADDSRLDEPGDDGGGTAATTERDGACNA